MKEDFLHYIWKFRQFSRLPLFTTKGLGIEVLDTGRHNHDAGPDFLNARIRIGDTLWAGSVEIHVRSSDWIKHGHVHDPSYDNVILHVVYRHDCEINQGERSELPTLELKDSIDFQSYRNYRSWISSGAYIPCANQLGDVPDHLITATIHAAAVERIKQKAEDCLVAIHSTKGDLEAAFHQVFMRSLGMKVNALPFEQLAKQTPFALIRKIASDRHHLEALFLGQAGFLEEEFIEGSYPDKLKNSYSFLSRKFHLTHMPVSAWKLFRLRPNNFPQVRLAQAAKFYFHHPSVVAELLSHKTIDGLNALFRTRLEEDLWLMHYTLKVRSAHSTKSFGTAFLKHLIINAVVPFVFALSEYNKDESIRALAILWMEQLSSEENVVIRKFGKLGVRARSALDSQGILELKKNRCDRKKCLQCKIGTHLIRSHAEIS
jgi:nucleoid DNA-binding protein